MAPIHRMTLFKVPNEADIEPILEKYRTLKQDAVKVLSLIHI